MRVSVIIPSKPMQIVSILERVLKDSELNYDVLTIKELNVNRLSDRDAVIVVGRDRDLLLIHQVLKENDIPILGVSIGGETSFLMDTHIENFRRAVEYLAHGNIIVEEITRIQVESDEMDAFAINEVAIFPRRSASLLEYALFINDEFVWRDHCDGVIIATPMGSTAYALSAGGAIIAPKARVLEIVSVNSIDPSRRPFVVPDESEISIREINSKYTIEIIVDGIVREPLKSDYLTIRVAKKPMKLLRLPRKERIYDERILKKMRLGEEILSLPPSAKLVLKVLEYEGPMTQKDLVEKTMLPHRTVRYALSILISRGLVREDLLNRDARVKIYRLSQSLRREK